jgi:hypothetical protein
VTLDHLYAIYRLIHREFDHACGSDPWPATLPPLARAVADFAEKDARDGRPPRSLSEFQRALAQGAAALGPLGWSPA